MNMFDDLVAFLNARLNEDEAAARYAGPARIAWLTYRDDGGQMLYTTVAAGEDHTPWVADGHELPDPTSARVIYDPARVLREVAADRKLVAAYEKTLNGPLPEPEDAASWRLALEYALALRVTVYSDHPDYR